VSNQLDNNLELKTFKQLKLDWTKPTPAVYLCNRRSTFYSLSCHFLCSDTTAFQRLRKKIKSRIQGYFLSGIFFLILSRVSFYHSWHLEVGFSNSDTVKEKVLSAGEYTQNRMALY